jgi:hypothetical protein
VRNPRPRQRHARFALAAALCAGLSALGAAPASATFHEIKIREVHEGGTSADYVELQAYAAGQNFLTGHYLVTYDSGGNAFTTYQFPADAPNGGNQRSVLIADTNPIGVIPDYVAPTANLFPGPSGSVCYLASLTPAPVGLDCVSIGATAPPVGTPSPVGTPVLQLAGGITAGQSAERSIARGCPTLLEATDDTDDSAGDFALATPSPRNNSTVPTEKPCVTNPPADTTPPNTKLKKRPPNRTRDRTPIFRFVSTEQGSRFRCKLDRKKPRSCRSPFTTKRLGFGSHTLRVTAIDRAGNADRTPAKDTFKVVRG